MKKSAQASFILFLSLFFAACASVPKEEKPLWADSYTVHHVFPPDAYVTGVAHAKTEETALVLADANLAAYFSREISSVTNASQELSNTGKNDETIQREITVKSQVDLAGIQHTQCWFDAESKQYFVCAYLNRKEAFKHYESSLIGHRENFYSFYNAAVKEIAPFKKIELFEQSKSSAEKYVNALQFAEILYKPGCAEYAKDRLVIAEIDRHIAVTKLHISMGLIVFGDTNGQYTPLFEQIISENGYKIKETDYAYTVNVAINSSKTFFADTIVVNPKIEIQIKDESETILSFSKTCDRISGFKEAETFLDTKIFTALKKVIVEDFAEFLRANGHGNTTDAYRRR